jgi:pantoate--beta-alanine ligase
MLSSLGVNVAWTPSPADMYPLGEAGIAMQVGPIAGWLCGQSRPQHFHGVAQVVAKLLNAVEPTHAFFGEKDWQQTRVIAQLIRDYLYPVELVVCPTLREADGVALSSRNRYLSPTERAIAPQLYQMLQNLATQAHAGQSVSELRDAGLRHLAQEPAWRLDYLEIRHEDDLLPVDTLRAGMPLRALVAAYLGQTRLIDNLRIVPM